MTLESNIYIKFIQRHFIHEKFKDLFNNIRKIASTTCFLKYNKNMIMLFIIIFIIMIIRRRRNRSDRRYSVKPKYLNNQSHALTLKTGNNLQNEIHL